MTKNLTSKESIFAKCSRGDAYEFPCGDYGTFLIRPWDDLTYRNWAVFTFDESGNQTKESDEYFREKVIQLSVVDESSHLIFDDDDLKQLAELSPVVKSSLYAECQRFVTLTDPEIEDAEKN